MTDAASLPLILDNIIDPLTISLVVVARRNSISIRRMWKRIMKIVPTPSISSFRRRSAPTCRRILCAHSIFLSHSLLLTHLPYQTFICLCEWVDVRRFWVSIFIWKFFGSTYASSYSYWWWWSLNYFECVLFSCLLSLVVGKAIDKHFRAHDSPFPLPFRAHPPRCQPRSNWFMQILEGNTSSSISTGVEVVVAEEISSTSRCSVELSNCRIGPTPSSCSRLYIVSSGFECLLVLLPVKSTGWRGHLACNSNSFGT